MAARAIQGDQASLQDSQGDNEEMVRMRSGRRSCWMMCLAGFALLPGACGAAERMVAERELSVPLSEISGLALRTTAGTTELLAVGDEAHEIVALPLVDGVPDVGRARRIPLSDRTGDSELEGIAVDAAGNAWLLVERGEIIAVDITGDRARELWRRPIEVPAHHRLAAAWNKRPNKRAEGLALVAGDDAARVFIVKQADPVALIELEAGTDHFVVGRTWVLSDLADASDLAVAEQTLYVVGSRSERVCAVPLPDDATGAAISCRSTLHLPARLGAGAPRWEGLARTSDGRLLVAIDRKATDGPNLALFPPSSLGRP